MIIMVGKDNEGFERIMKDLKVIMKDMKRS